jgi:hypothetical protein
LIGTVASLESTVLGVVGGVVGTSDTVEDMLTVVSSVGTGGVANLEAEDVATHEVVPLDNLFVGAVAARPSGRIDETTEGVATEICTVGVKLSSEVVGLKVDLGLVDETNDLNVVGCPHELNSLKSASGDKTRAVTGLGAPRDFLSFSVSDGLGTIWRGPKTEVVDRVEDAGLAERLLIFRRRVTKVITELRATDTIVRVSLVWEVAVVEMLGSQGNDG